LYAVGAGAGTEAKVGAGVEPTTDKAAALQSGGTISPGRITPSSLGFDTELALDGELETVDRVPEGLDETVEGSGAKLGGFFLFTWCVASERVGDSPGEPLDFFGELTDDGTPSDERDPSLVPDGQPTAEPPTLLPPHLLPSKLLLRSG
jgi:hypothetical protein